MSYFLFQKNLNNVDGTVYKIAENENNLNNLNIVLSDYKIIEGSLDFFNQVKYGTKQIIKYDNDLIIAEDLIITYSDRIGPKGKVYLSAKDNLNSYVYSVKQLINPFLENNINHPEFKLWNDYLNQLNLLDLNSIQFPLNCSLEQYFKDQNLISLNPLQIP
jgi:hypothetical protein